MEVTWTARKYSVEDRTIVCVKNARSGLKFSHFLFSF